MYRRKQGSSSFGREYRLKSNSVIRNLIRKGKRFYGNHLFFRYDTLEDSRKQFCIKVPKRLGNAVRRNRIKRVLREVLRSNKDRFKPGTRAIILVKSVPDTNETNCVFEDIMRYVEHA